VDSSCTHFNDYNHNYESTTTNMIMITTRGNYDYKYDYTTNVTILKYLIDLVSPSFKINKNTYQHGQICIRSMI